jgi:hypothetical protein
MKIKTITCHQVYNHGASLQEYALLAYLESIGHTASAIYYKPDYLSQHFNLWCISNPQWESNIILKVVYLLLKLPGRFISLKRKMNFDVFEKKYIKTAHHLYKSNDELKEKLPEADAYICGSDQIWNSFFPNGTDPAFYLDFVPDNKLKIAYAPSFATDEISQEVKAFVKEKVDRIDYVSVRETSGVIILSELGIDNVTQVLDPVFLLSADHWESEFVQDINESFVFIYDFDGNPLVEKLAKLIAKERKLKIFTVNQNIKYAHKNFYLEGPRKFISLMFNAKFIITNSFHSVAFSLIFQKQFVVVNRTEKINTRMRDLLDLFDLSHLLITDENDFKSIGNIDHQKTMNYRQMLTNNSKEYLKKALQ